MYELEPQLAESDYRGAFAEALARFRRRALLVVLTELAEQAVIDETLLPALPLMVRHHLVVVAGVRDPDVVALGAGHARRRERGVPQGRRRRRARRAAPRDRAGCGAWARRSSTRRPAGSRPQLADAYLRVKATGRL